jgi:hypothetical protein
MSIQTLRTADNGSKGKGRQVLGLVGSLALAVMVTAGVVVGRSDGKADSTETAVVTAELAVTPSENEVAHAGQPSAPVYYIVGSAVQAAATLTEIAQQNRLRSLNGERDIQAIIFVAGSTEAEEALTRLQATNQTRYANGLPEITVMDLR